LVSLLLLYVIYAVWRYRILTEDLGIGLKVNEWKIAAIQADLGVAAKSHARVGMGRNYQTP